MEQPTGTPTTPAGVVAAAGAAIHPLGEALWAAKTSDELVGTVEQIEDDTQPVPAPCVQQVVGD